MGSGSIYSAQFRPTPSSSVRLDLVRFESVVQLGSIRRPFSLIRYHTTVEFDLVRVCWIQSELCRVRFDPILLNRFGQIFFDSVKFDLIRFGSVRFGCRKPKRDVFERGGCCRRRRPPSLLPIVSRNFKVAFRTADVVTSCLHDSFYSVGYVRTYVRTYLSVLCNFCRFDHLSAAVVAAPVAAAAVAAVWLQQ